MKEKPGKTKFSLNKETISALDEREMKNLKGGTGLSIQTINIELVTSIMKPQPQPWKPQPDPWKPDPTPWSIINISVGH